MGRRDFELKPTTLDKMADRQNLRILGQLSIQGQLCLGGFGLRSLELV